MSPAKKGNSSSRRGPRGPSSGGPVGWGFGLGRPLAGLLLIAALFGGAAYWAWRHVSPRVLSSESYWLGLENVEITPRPEWINTDIRVQVFRDASLDRPVSITEDDLVERIRSAFALHPWVAKVERVQKFQPARVKVDLIYRRPVCMVEIAGELSSVDAEGVVLPREDFSSVEASRYPRLVGIETAPPGIAGTRWGDDRVLGGAEVAAALFGAWDKLGLSRIEAGKPPDAGLHETPAFDLLTRNGTRIRWGRGPSEVAPGEIPPKEKVARLEKYMAEHGSLEGQPGGVGLDLSRPQASEGSRPAGQLLPLPQRKTQP